MKKNYVKILPLFAATMITAAFGAAAPAPEPVPAAVAAVPLPVAVAKPMSVQSLITGAGPEIAPNTPQFSISHQKFQVALPLKPCNDEASDPKQKSEVEAKKKIANGIFGVIRITDESDFAKIFAAAIDKHVVQGEYPVVTSFDHLMPATLLSSSQALGVYAYDPRVVTEKKVPILAHIICAPEKDFTKDTSAARYLIESLEQVAESLDPTSSLIFCKNREKLSALSSAAERVLGPQLEHRGYKYNNVDEGTWLNMDPAWGGFKALISGLGGTPDDVLAEFMSKDFAASATTSTADATAATAPRANATETADPKPAATTPAAGATVAKAVPVPAVVVATPVAAAAAAKPATTAAPSANVAAASPKPVPATTTVEPKTVAVAVTTPPTTGASGAKTDSKQAAAATGPAKPAAPTVYKHRPYHPKKSPPTSTGASTDPEHMSPSS